jgi:hypothetical protein
VLLDDFRRLFFQILILFPNETRPILQAEAAWGNSSSISRLFRDTHGKGRAACGPPLSQMTLFIADCFNALASFLRYRNEYNIFCLIFLSDGRSRSSVA